jgi:hypothetical protein
VILLALTLDSRQDRIEYSAYIVYNTVRDFQTSQNDFIDTEVGDIHQLSSKTFV